MIKWWWVTQVQSEFCQRIIIFSALSLIHSTWKKTLKGLGLSVPLLPMQAASHDHLSKKLGGSQENIFIPQLAAFHKNTWF